MYTPATVQPLRVQLWLCMPVWGLCQNLFGGIYAVSPLFSPPPGSCPSCQRCLAVSTRFGVSADSVK